MSSNHLYGWQHSRFHEKTGWFVTEFLLPHPGSMIPETHVLPAANCDEWKFSLLQILVFFLHFFFSEFIFSPNQFFPPSFLRFFFWKSPSKNFFGVHVKKRQCQKKIQLGSEMIRIPLEKFHILNPNPFWDLWFGSDDVPLKKKGGVGFQVQHVQFQGNS